MEPENEKILAEGAKAFGVDLNEEKVEAFDLYLRELLKWNQKINLTAIRTEREVVTKHFLDSLSICPYVLRSSFLLDIGSGPGFPGIPLKMVAPSLEVTLIDSIRKKVDFQRHIIRRLGLKGIEAVHGRVQEKEMIGRMEGRFDRTVSRAFADLQTFLRVSGPLLTSGGVALAMKGDLKEEENRTLTEAGKAGFRFLRAIPLTLPFTSLKRTIFLFEKQ